MTSADFSQFVVTTANETACETSPLKVRTLSLHVPATFTGTSSNFWTSAFLAALSVFPSLICDFCPSGQRFACSFLQIPPCDGHPCCSAMCFVVAYAHSGLSPVRARPWRANKIQAFREKAKCLYACKRVCESQRQEIHITCMSFFSMKQLSGLRPTASAPERLRQHRSHLLSWPRLLLTYHLPAFPPSHLPPGRLPVPDGLPS